MAQGPYSWLMGKMGLASSNEMKNREKPVPIEKPVLVLFLS